MRWNTVSVRSITGHPAPKQFLVDRYKDARSMDFELNRGSGLNMSRLYGDSHIFKETK